MDTPPHSHFGRKACGPSTACGRISAMTAHASRGFRVDCDWRGETAYYMEEGRRVWMTCLYWGGRAGSVSHIHAVWEYEDGRREPLTPDERAEVLRRVIQYVQDHHHISLEAHGE